MIKTITSIRNNSHKNNLSIQFFLCLIIIIIILANNYKEKMKLSFCYIKAKIEYNAS